MKRMPCFISCLPEEKRNGYFFATQQNTAAQYTYTDMPLYVVYSTLHQPQRAGPLLTLLFLVMCITICNFWQRYSFFEITDYQAPKSQRGGALHKVQFLRGEGCNITTYGILSRGGVPLLAPRPLRILCIACI